MTLLPETLLPETLLPETPLPEPAMDVLHILPSTSQMGWWLILAMLLALPVLVLILRMLAHRSRPATTAPEPEPAPTPVARPAVGVVGRIAALEEKILRSKAFRDGCHALAGLIKSDLEQRSGLAVEKMTSSEIEHAFRDSKVTDPQIGGFMTRLSRRRYGRDAPRRRHFVEACDKARELLGGV